jgi:hypothetical protein
MFYQAYASTPEVVMLDTPAFAQLWLHLIQSPAEALPAVTARPVVTLSRLCSLIHDWHLLWT